MTEQESQQKGTSSPSSGRWERKQSSQSSRNPTAEKWDRQDDSGMSIRESRRNQSRPEFEESNSTGAPRNPAGRKLSFNLNDLNTELESRLGKGRTFERDDFEELKVKYPKHPKFPYGILMLTIAKDFVDLVSLGFLGTFTNILAWIMIRIYLMGKVGFIKRWLYKRYIFTTVLEYVPWVNMIPQWTIFVLRGYASEKKAIDEVLTSIEKLIIRHGKGS